MYRLHVTCDNATNRAYPPCIGASLTYGGINLLAGWPLSYAKGRVASAAAPGNTQPAGGSPLTPLDAPRFACRILPKKPLTHPPSAEADPGTKNLPGKCKKVIRSCTATLNSMRRHGATNGRRVSAMRRLVFAALIALILVLLSASKAE